jgi:hypothetical protein
LSLSVFDVEGRWFGTKACKQPHAGSSALHIRATAMRSGNRTFRTTFEIDRWSLSQGPDLGV